MHILYISIECMENTHFTLHSYEESFVFNLSLCFRAFAHYFFHCAYYVAYRHNNTGIMCYIQHCAIHLPIICTI